jgi:GNAT superfamily N-acetyltransferase
LNLEPQVQLEVRTARAEDYLTIAQLHNADNEPHFHTTAAQLEQSDSKNEHGTRIVAVRDTEVIGTAESWFWSGVNVYRVGVHVISNSSHDEVAAQLLEFLERNARGAGATRLLATVRSDFLENACYLRRGFKEVFRSFGANLELKDFQPNQFVELETALSQRNVRILPRSQWLALDAETQLDALQLEANADIPGYEPVVSMRMDFRDRKLLEPFWVALQGETCVGFSSLNGDAGKPVIHFNATAVKRTHRNCGVGLALAARAVVWAKTQGFTEVNDGGARANTPHVRILERLGFELEPDWVTFEKSLEVNE